jgi:hypothetical protein
VIQDMLRRLFLIICIVWTGIAILIGWQTYENLMQYPSPDIPDPLNYSIGIAGILFILLPVAGKCTMMVVRYVMTGSPRKGQKLLPYRYYR